LLVAFACTAEARPRHRRRNPIVTALQPFRDLHDVVHAVAAPLVRTAPRVLAAAAVEPINVAFYAPRAIRAYRARPRSEGAEDFDDTEGGSESDAPTARPPEEVNPAIESRGSHPTVAGSRALLRDGVAYAPSHAPQNVKNAIWAVNAIRRKPYAMGGGHGSFNDSAYDCSGTVSFALHFAGALASPLPSSDLQRFGERGRGRWITVYARSGHTFAEIAGLRLDTTDFHYGGDVGPRWHEDFRDTRGFVARHPAGL
jgi:cell wall-associated NlpC family hydrolase